MRACLPHLGALMTALGCGTREPSAPATSDAAADAQELGVDVAVHDSTPTPWDSTEPPGEKDTDIGPVGHCLYDSIDWTCRSGHICTIFGKCTPDDAGPSEAGSQSCGIIWCDREYCSCRTASVSLCDCN